MIKDTKNVEKKSTWGGSQYMFRYKASAGWLSGWVVKNITEM